VNITALKVHTERLWVDLRVFKSRISWTGLAYVLHRKIIHAKFYLWKLKEGKRPLRRLWIHSIRD